jgi:site-specific recombinase XerD
MLEKSFGLLFFMRKSKNYTGGLLPIYIKITVDGLPKEISTKRKWDPERWNPQAGRASGTREDVKTLNQYLDSLEQKIHQAKRKLLEENQPITAEGIKNILTGNVEKKKTLLEVFQHHNDQLHALVGVDFAPGTVERYETSYRHTKSFIDWKYDAEDFNIEDLNYEFISEYAFWLKTIRKCSHNTTMKYLANFKKVVLICVKNNWIKSDPFVKFKLTKKNIERTPLTDVELKKVREKKFATDRLDVVRDMFLFSCFTGLSYIDIKQLKTSEIATGIDKESWIFSKRQKTSSPTHIPLLQPALTLINKYRRHPKCLHTDLVFPVMTNQKMNSYLKEIADFCGIHKNLTFHIARHTFATTVTLANGVPIESVSKMLGHSNLTQTQHYAKILDKKVSDDMRKLRKTIA